MSTRVPSADNTATRDAALADAYAAQVERWARAAGTTDAVASTASAAARALSLATADGHVCVLLDELLPLPAVRDAASLRTQLLTSGVVGPAAAPGTQPMVLDDDGRLYLHRYFDAERRLAQRLVTAMQTPPADAPADHVAGDEQQASLFEPTADATASAITDQSSSAPVDWQRIAVELALRRKLTVISGGPGTGKTSTVVQLLARLLEHNPQCRIALAAPTGKAAARMSAALRERAAAWPDELRSKLPDSASTVHRLLGLAHGRIRHDARHPLAIDALVVDEASMLDLSLATKLLDAVPPDARIVLLGDKDQLSAVESGAVFAELSADPSLSDACRHTLAAACGVAADAIAPPPPTTQSPDTATSLQDSVVWLTRNYRFAADSAIGRWAQNARAGQMPPPANDADASSPAGNVHWLSSDADTTLDVIRRRIVDGYAAYLDALRTQPHDAAAVLAAYDRFRVLCATRRGARGSAALNRWLETALRSALADDSADASPWYLGRPVMVLRNDPVQKLYNGDTGIVLPSPDGERRVVFPAPDGGVRVVAPLRLPLHETAYALTVHKAQGSEYDDVLLLLPEAPNRVLTRELLYTGLTRARRHLTVVGSAAVVAQAVESPTVRRSGLMARLADALAAR